MVWRAMSTGRAIVVLVVLLVGGVAFPAQAAPARSSQVRVTAKAAILIDAHTDTVLWSRNPDLRLPPASTTKIVTALLALQSGRLNEPFVVTARAAAEPPSKVGLKAGWKMRLRDLVYALLLNSANDASVVIAQGLAGSVPAFAGRMNAEARALGATHTHFVNPNGLPAADHYSTARDMATMFGHAMQNPLFAKIVGTRSGAVSPIAVSHRIVLHNHNRLLDNYPIHVVGKTGWTIAAKKCFVGAATDDGRQLLVAVLGSRNLWGDLRQLINFGFRDTNPSWRPNQRVETTHSAAGNDDTEAGNAQRVYAVRLATFRHFKNAQRLKHAVTRKGYPAKIVRVQRKHRRLYRVSVGTYPSRRVAQRVARRIKHAHQQLRPLVVARN